MNVAPPRAVIALEAQGRKRDNAGAGACTAVCDATDDDDGDEDGAAAEADVDDDAERNGTVFFEVIQLGAGRKKSMPIAPGAGSMLEQTDTIISIRATLQEPTADRFARLSAFPSVGAHESDVVLVLNK